jgi:hypothetical protein
MQNTDSQKRASRRMRTIVQTIMLAVLAVPFVLSLSTPQQYSFWFLNAGIFLIGLMLTGGALLYGSPFADAIGIQTRRSRSFYLTLGIILIVVPVVVVLFNLRVL